MPDERRVIVAEPPRTCVIGKPSKIKELRQLTTQDGTVCSFGIGLVWREGAYEADAAVGEWVYIDCKTLYIDPGSPWQNGYIEKVYIGFLERAIL